MWICECGREWMCKCGVGVSRCVSVEKMSEQVDEYVCDWYICVTCSMMDMAAIS